VEEEMMCGLLIEMEVAEDLALLGDIKNQREILVITHITSCSKTLTTLD
jgi:hypothetical protein